MQMKANAILFDCVGMLNDTKATPPQISRLVVQGAVNRCDNSIDNSVYFRVKK